MPADPNEVSPSGAAILRHEAKERDWTAPAHAEGEEEIVAHCERFFGKAANVLHEIVSDLVHLDVHLIAPSKQSPCWTLFTTGMSARPMLTPPGAEEYRFAELLLRLPTDWPVERLETTPPPPDQEAIYWPIYWLKSLARLPHDHETWLGFGHTIPNGDPARPFALGTHLCGWLLLPPFGPEEVQRVTRANGETVHLYCMHALTAPEMSLKLNRGLDPLLDALSDANVSEVLQPARPSAVRRKLFGLF